MVVTRSANDAFEPQPFELSKPKWLFWLLPILICLIHLSILFYLARQHPIGNFATETDFYHFYAPDAERIAAGQFPTNTYQGPGYPALLALIAKLTGTDLFTIGKWLSVFCSTLCGLMIFLLFQRLFDYLVALGAQLISLVSGEFAQFAINATTDIFFLLLCLSVLVVFINEWLPVQWRLVLAGALTGLAYLTRYNGLFLLVACLVGIILLNLFERSWRGRWALSTILIVSFFVAASPWFYANYKHHGSPFYNTNYLNIATEFYPELVAGKTNQDGTRAVERQFSSFGDVLRYDPKRLLSHYPVNLFESLRLSVRDNLVNQWVGWAAVLGIALALIRRRSKPVLFVLISAAIYVLMMALSHWEARYYFFLMVLYAGFSVYAVSLLSRLVPERRPAVAGVICLALFVALWMMSLAESRRDVNRFLASRPVEVMAARDYLASINQQGARLRIVARKPHLPYLSRNDWVFFPQVKSLDEFRAWVETNQIDYIAIGRRELRERKELTPLGDPKNAPTWLKAVWVHDNPNFILYKPELKSAGDN
jgi:4-amino-4-deoxy-L-arabinose transferase-like glycosyltransferase